MNIRGTALRPGLAAPKMPKNYRAHNELVFRFWKKPTINAVASLSLNTYAEDDDEEEVDVCDIMELEPQILRQEA